MAKILILTLVFRPDNVSTAQLMADLSLKLKSKGHTVTVLTTTPHYNKDNLAEETQILLRTKVPLLLRSEHQGIAVYHVWMPRKGTWLVYRALTWVMFQVLSTLYGCFVLSRADVILCPSPPPTIGISAWIIGLCRRTKYIYNVQEVYPDVAINLGLLKSKAQIFLARKVESFVYAKAAAVTVISERMQKKLDDRVTDKRKLHLIPNFVKTDDFAADIDAGSFRHQHGLEGKFVVCYAGNIGKPQNIDLLIAAAAAMQEVSRLAVVIVGNGSERERLERNVREMKLGNVFFLGQRPYSEMPMIYAATDLAYVPQAIGISDDGIPSKVYRILGAGRPVLACTERESDLAILIRDASAGYIAVSNSVEEVVDILRQAERDAALLARMGRQGLDFVRTRYSLKTVSEKYDELVNRVSEG